MEIQSDAQETGESVTVTDPQSVLGRAAIAMCEVDGGTDWQKYVLMTIAALNVATSHIDDEAERGRSDGLCSDDVFDGMMTAAGMIEPQLSPGYRANTAKTLEEAHHAFGTPWQERTGR